MTDFLQDPPPPEPPDKDPEPPLPPPAPEPPESVDTKVAVENIASQNTVVAGKISFISQYFPDPTAPATFSAEVAWELTAVREGETKELFVCDPTSVELLLEDLEQRRVLLLSGARGAGKATTAIYLSTRIAERCRPTLLVDPLDPQVRIDLRQVAATRRFAERVTVFTDTFTRRNRDLLGFFTRTNQAGWEELTNTLRTNKAYIIFTADTEDVARLRRQFAESLACCRDVPPLGPELVARGFDRKIEWLNKTQRATPEHEGLANQHREAIVKELTTLERVSQFLDQYVTGDPDVASALRRFHDLGFWFTKDLATDADAWCFALTLALAESVRKRQSPGWYDFERIRRAISERIKSDPEIFPRRRRNDASNELETDDRTTGQALSDDQLLARCRADISGSSSRLGDAVRFTDRSYAETLWTVIAAHHRRALTAILPVLRALAETTTETYGVRSLAAAMLGRIGELDPFAMSLPLLRRDWVQGRDVHQRPFVGSVVQGVLATRNPRYCQAAMGAIESLTAEDTGSPAELNDRLLTAISVYSQIGEQDLDEAMNRLGAIATKHLAPEMENLSTIGRLVDDVERRILSTSSARVAEDLLNHRFRLGRAANKLSKRHAEALLALVRAIVYLCIANDAVQVLHAMRDWIAKGGPSTGTLVALLFLHGGIAEKLEELSANVRSMAGTQVGNPILISLANGDDAILRLGAFLADLHASINQPFVLPIDIQRELNESLAECLTTWAQGAAESDTSRALVEDLFVLLTNIRNSAMRERIYQLFASETFNKKVPLRTFAANVRRKCLENAK